MLSLEEVEGTVNVKLSAALRATEPIESWRAKGDKVGDYWNIRTDTPARVDVVFTVDPMTRVTVTVHIIVGGCGSNNN